MKKKEESKNKKKQTKTKLLLRISVHCTVQPKIWKYKRTLIENEPVDTRFSKQAIELTRRNYML